MSSDDTRPYRAFAMSRAGTPSKNSRSALIGVDALACVKLRRCPPEGRVELRAVRSIETVAVIDRRELDLRAVRQVNRLVQLSAERLTDRTVTQVVVTSAPNNTATAKSRMRRLASLIRNKAIPPSLPRVRPRIVAPSTARGARSLRKGR